MTGRDQDEKEPLLVVNAQLVRNYSNIRCVGKEFYSSLADMSPTKLAFMNTSKSRTLSRNTVQHATLRWGSIRFGEEAFWTSVWESNYLERSC